MASLFDLQKVKEYLDKLEGVDREFIYDLLDATTYVTKENFFPSVYESFDKFKQHIQDKPFYIDLAMDKIGSEHWLTYILWPELRQMNYSKHLVKNVLIIDDAVYTGTNVFGRIDEISYNNKGVEFNFHLVIPYLNRDGAKFLLDECKLKKVNCYFHSSYYIYPPLDFYKYYTNPNKELRERFGVSLKFDLPVENMIALYFDHKVAAPESTFSSIYLHGRLPDGSSYGSLFKKNPSRHEIQRIADDYKNYQGNYLDYLESKH
jgi:hypothetical protein